MMSVHACRRCRQIGRDSSYCPSCGRRLESLDFKVVYDLMHDQRKGSSRREAASAAQGHGPGPFSES